MLWIILGVIVFLLAAVGAISLYFFKLSVLRDGVGPAVEEGGVTPWSGYDEVMKQARIWIDENYTEEIVINSFDGLKLTALFIPAENAKGTMILMHGYRSVANLDFAPEAEFMQTLGYNLILPYQRGHGSSEGKYITYGFNERFDCLEWAKYTEKRFGENSNIFLGGISMGCATVVMAAGLDLPKNVRGIMADCGFTSPWDVMVHVGKRNYHMPAFPILSAANLWSRTIAKFDFKAVSTIDVMKKNKIPMLFIHGDSDTFVPTYMTQQNYDACAGEKEIYLVKGAGHAQSFLVDTEGCSRVITEFVEKYER